MSSIPPQYSQCLHMVMGPQPWIMIRGKSPLCRLSLLHAMKFTPPSSPSTLMNFQCLLDVQVLCPILVFLLVGYDLVARPLGYVAWVSSSLIVSSQLLLKTNLRLLIICYPCLFIGVYPFFTPFSYVSFSMSLNHYGRSFPYLTSPLNSFGGASINHFDLNITTPNLSPPLSQYCSFPWVLKITH